MKIKATAASILLLATAGLYSQQQTAALWQADLDYLVKRIEIMHPNPYAYFPREEFHRLKDALSDKLPRLSEADIVISISELLAKLMDGHTRVGFESSDPAWLDQTFHLLPFVLYSFDDGFFIQAGTPEHKEWVGAKVLRIGNMSVEEAAGKLGALYSHDNRQGQRKNLIQILSLAEMLKYIGAVEAVDRISLTLRNAKNQEIIATVAPVSFVSMAPFLGTWYPQASNQLATMNEQAENPLPLWLKDRESKFWFEYLPEEKLMFLQINSLNSPHGDGKGSFGEFCSRFFKAFDECQPEKLVVDVRANNGGNHVELPLLKGIIARPHIDRHDKLFLVIGRVTFSAAQHFTTLFDKWTNATIIGEATSGKPNHYGAYRRFKLPNHPQVTIGCSIDYYQDSEPFDFNTTTSPEIRTKITSADYRANIDPAMRVVRDYERIRRRVQSLALELGEEYASAGFPGMKNRLDAIKGELLDMGYDLEKFLSDFNDNFFYSNKKNKADYLEFLTCAVTECPESIDFCYALASFFEAEGQLQEAKRYYRQCLQLNPSCHYAKMKLGLMEKPNYVR
jgi:hypothetical protein